MFDPATGKIVTDGCFDTLGSTIKRADDGSDVPLTVTVFDDRLPVPDDHDSLFITASAACRPRWMAVRLFRRANTWSRGDGGRSHGEPAGDCRIESDLARDAGRTCRAGTRPGGPNENIRLSQHNTTVPAGSTLTILPGTMIMVDTTGKIEDGTLSR